MDQSHSWPKGKIKSDVGGLLRSRRAYAGGFVIKDVPRGLYLGRLDPSLAPSTLTAFRMHHFGLLALVKRCSCVPL